MSNSVFSFIWPLSLGPGVPAHHSGTACPWRRDLYLDRQVVTSLRNHTASHLRGCMTLLDTLLKVAAHLPKQWWVNQLGIVCRTFKIIQRSVYDEPARIPFRLVFVAFLPVVWAGRICACPGHRNIQEDWRHFCSWLCIVQSTGNVMNQTASHLRGCLILCPG